MLGSSLFNNPPPPPYYFCGVRLDLGTGFRGRGSVIITHILTAPLPVLPSLPLYYDSLYCLLFTHLGLREQGGGGASSLSFVLSLSLSLIFFFSPWTSHPIPSCWREIYVCFVFYWRLLCSTLLYSALLGIGALFFFFRVFFFIVIVIVR